MTGYDVLGNIAIVKFARDESKKKKLLFASKLMKESKGVTTVLEKAGKFSGRLRTQKGKYILGEKTKEALYKENGCEFRFNVDSCYFSPRLASERKEIAGMIRKGERVLVLFGGVAPFAIVIARLSGAERIVSVELGRDCSRYAVENVKRNKLSDKVDIVQGDVRRVCPKMTRQKQKFDRIVMARPNLKDDFLDVALPLVKKGGVIHYYGFYDEDKMNDMAEMINGRAKEAKRKVKILNVKKAGDIGVKKFRYRADIKVN
jgi:tRNA (guanine37-N1)-methyltransferase